MGWNKKTNPNDKLIFIHTPKTGGTFTRQVLRDLKIKNRGHHHATYKEFDKNITFTIIREPVARFESFLNYRLQAKNPRKDWPQKIKYVYQDSSITLNNIVSKCTDNELKNFSPYRSLNYWSKNINIFITIDQLFDFLSFFGYKCDIAKYSKKNVSNKNRGTFSEITKIV